MFPFQSNQVIYTGKHEIFPKSNDLLDGAEYKDNTAIIPIPLK
jgi:hypothetical protein